MFRLIRPLHGRRPSKELIQPRVEFDGPNATHNNSAATLAADRPLPPWYYRVRALWRHHRPSAGVATMQCCVCAIGGYIGYVLHSARNLDRYFDRMHDCRLTAADMSARVLRLTGQRDDTSARHSVKSGQAQVGGNGDPVAWADIAPTLRTGDLVLLYGTGFTSWRIAAFTFLLSGLRPSALRFSHVAVVVRPEDLSEETRRHLLDRQKKQINTNTNENKSNDEGKEDKAAAAAAVTPDCGVPGEPLLLECVDNRDIHAVNRLTGLMTYDAVTATLASDRIFGKEGSRWCYKRMSVRQIQDGGIEWTPKRKQQLENFLTTRLDGPQPLEKSIRMCSVFLHRDIYPRNGDPASGEPISCGELVARFYQAIDVFHKDSDRIVTLDAEPVIPPHFRWATQALAMVPYCYTSDGMGAFGGYRGGGGDNNNKRNQNPPSMDVVDEHMHPYYHLLRNTTGATAADDDKMTPADETKTSSTADETTTTGPTPTKTKPPKLPPKPKYCIAPDGERLFADPSGPRFGPEIAVDMSVTHPPSLMSEDGRESFPPFIPSMSV